MSTSGEVNIITAKERNDATVTTKNGIDQEHMLEN